VPEDGAAITLNPGEAALGEREEVSQSEVEE